MCKKAVVFQTSFTELKGILISENLSDIVANSLYQNKGVISLEYVKLLKTEEDEGKKAQKLLNQLQQIISNDELQFESVVSELGSFEKLHPAIQGMRDKMCKLNSTAM